MVRILNNEVTVRRPSRASKVRVLAGLSRRAVTRVRRVEDWMAGQLAGSRRSRRRFMYISRAKREREGGWRRRVPWIRSRVEMMRRSFVPLLPRPRRCSRQDIRRIATGEVILHMLANFLFPSTTAVDD